MKRLTLIIAFTSLILAPRHADADLYVANVTLPNPPTPVSTGNPITSLVADFGRYFSTITSIQYTGTFSGDLWAANELWSIDGSGQTFLSGPPRSAFSQTRGDSGYFSNFLDGVHSFQFEFEGSANLSTLQVVLNGVAVVPEASSFALMAATGLLAGCAWWVRRTR
jgi:hypothetical protein